MQAPGPTIELQGQGTWKWAQDPTSFPGGGTDVSPGATCETYRGGENSSCS